MQSSDMDPSDHASPQISLQLPPCVLMFHVSVLKWLGLLAAVVTLGSGQEAETVIYNLSNCCGLITSKSPEEVKQGYIIRSI